MFFLNFVTVRDVFFETAGTLPNLSVHNVVHGRVTFPADVDLGSFTQAKMSAATNCGMQFHEHTVWSRKHIEILSWTWIHCAFVMDIHARESDNSLNSSTVHWFTLSTCEQLAMCWTFLDCSVLRTFALAT